MTGTSLTTTAALGWASLSLAGGVTTVDLRGRLIQDKRTDVGLFVGMG